jgi:hypothetical protein
VGKAQRRVTNLVQGETGITRDGKVEVQREVIHLLAGLAQSGIGLDPLQAVADEPDAVDEQAVGGALDLKVAEEGVCAEEAEDLVEDVVALALDLGGLVRGKRRVREGQDVGRAAGLGAQGEEGEVADEAGRVGVRVEVGVVGLEESREIVSGFGHGGVDAGWRVKRVGGILGRGTLSASFRRASGELQADRAMTSLPP